MRSRFLLLFSVLLAILSCSKEKTYNNCDILVAKVGAEGISLKDLEISFISEPQYMVRTPLRQARLSQLNFLIDEKYAYLAAARINLENDLDLQKKINYIKKQEILKAYLQQNFLNKVKVAPADLQQGLQRAGKLIFVQNIFCSTLAAAQKVQQQLTMVENGDETFRKQGVELGWITFGTLDPKIEDAVYNLKAGEISDLAKSDYGYHILKVDTIRSNPEFQTISQTLKLQQVTDIIRKREAQVEIHQYLSELADNKKIQIANHSLELVLKSISEVSPDRNQEPLVLAPPLQNNDLMDISLKLENILQEPLLKFGNEQMTIGDFLEHLKEMPPYHRPYLNGRNRIVQSMIDMVRNDLLLKQATAEGYAEKNNVRETYTKCIKELLAREFNRRYHAKDFQQTNSLEWNRYQRILFDVRQDYKQSIYPQNLFSAVVNPDSILTAAPVPVFFTNKYTW